MRRLQDIANIDGLKITGVYSDGKIAVLTVTRDTTTHMHYLKGHPHGKSYRDLVGWY